MRVGTSLHNKQCKASENTCLGTLGILRAKTRHSHRRRAGHSVSQVASRTCQTSTDEWLGTTTALERESREAGTQPQMHPRNGAFYTRSKLDPKTMSARNTP
jgi:hypothetical protein